MTTQNELWEEEKDLALGEGRDAESQQQDEQQKSRNQEEE